MVGGEGLFGEKSHGQEISDPMSATQLPCFLGFLRCDSGNPKQTNKSFPSSNSVTECRINHRIYSVLGIEAITSRWHVGKQIRTLGILRGPSILTGINAGPVSKPNDIRTGRQGNIRRVLVHAVKDSVPSQSSVTSALTACSLFLFTGS